MTDSCMGTAFFQFIITSIVYVQFKDVTCIFVFETTGHVRYLQRAWTWYRNAQF